MPVHPDTTDPFDRAIGQCDERIKWLRKALRYIAGMVFVGIVTMLGILGFFLWYLSAQKEKQVFTVIIFAILTVFAIVFGVLMSVYRSHLNEIANTEHYRMGFLRVHLAAQSTSKGYQSEVRDALTDRAFTPPARPTMGSRKAIESPLPGHLGVDALTVAINRMMDHFEIRAAKKPDKDD